jgi:hypothetical protein
MPSWQAWAAEILLLPWIGPAAAFLVGSGEIEPISLLVGVILWPIGIVIAGIRQARRREGAVIVAGPTRGLPPPLNMPLSLRTYSILAKASLVPYFLFTLLMALLVSAASDVRAGRLHATALLAIIAAAYFLYVAGNLVAFRRLRLAVRQVNALNGFADLEESVTTNPYAFNGRSSDATRSA